MYRIALNTLGGELDFREVKEDDEEKVARIAAQMIEKLGLLSDGDTITVTWIETDED